MPVWMSRRTACLVLSVLALTVTGCGQTTPTAATAKDRAKQLLIGVDALPEEYRVANGQEYPGESKVCGITLEPEDVRGFAMKRYTRTIIGPFLYQFVFVGNDSANRKLVTKVDKKLKTCTTDVTETDDGKITYEVTALRKLPHFGQDSLGARLVPEPEGPTSEYLLIQHDDVLVLLFTVAPEGIEPPRELLVSGAKAVTSQFEGASE